MPPLQFCLYIRQRQAPRREQDQGMIEEVGHLGDYLRVTLPFGGEDDLHGFLPDFFHNFVFACGKQPGRVRAWGRVFPASEDNLKKTVEVHGQSPPFPPGAGRVR